MYFLPQPPPFDTWKFGLKEHVRYGNNNYFFKIAPKVMLDELIK